MQNHHQDAMFDNNKYYFPPGTLDTPGQPWLEVVPERDEQGTPGLQPIAHDEHKYADIAVRGLHNEAPPYRTHGAAHADELTSQGMQAVPIPEPQQPVQFQSQFQSQLQPQLQPPHQWPETGVNNYYGQPFQTASSSQVSGYSTNHPMYGVQPAVSNAENPYPAANPSSLWVKDEHQGQVKKKIEVKRWVLWAIGGFILIVAVVGAVVGGVLRTRAANVYNGGNALIISNTPSDGASIEAPRSIRNNSRLAVTGYRTDTGYSIRLFYQGQDRQLRFMDKNNTSANWTEPTILDTLPYQPKENGTITSGSYLFGIPAPKIEFFYEDRDGIVRGQNFNFEFENGSIPLKGEAGSINTYPLQTASDTRISCYFPYIASQDADNSVRWTVMHGQNTRNLSAPWWVNDTNWIKASKGSGFAVLPIAQNYVNAGGIVYRSPEGMLSVRMHDESEPSNADVAWRAGALSKEIPADTAIGAFSVGRPYDNNNQINTYILYQDEDDVIQVVWQDNNTDGWKGPKTYDALQGASKGTDIACLTAGVYGAANVVSREQDMNRCWFQIPDGRVKEVWFDGSQWQDVGIVPLP